MIRPIETARLRALVRASGTVRLPIVLDGNEIGTVPRELVRLLLRVKGATFALEDFPEYAIVCGLPRGRYRMRVLRDDQRSPRKIERTSPSRPRTPEEDRERARLSYRERDVWDREHAQACKRADVERDRMERVEVWDEHAQAWKAGLDPSEIRRFLALE